MKVAFHVRRGARRHPAVAALLPERDPARLLGLCARLGLDPGGRVFDVAGGLLLKLASPTEAPLPGAIRLRALAPDLLVPVDGELVPALLDDEARGLVRDRGLVVLAGGRVLGFDPRAPRSAASLVTAPGVFPRAWEPLPDRPGLADRIEEILIDRPEETPEGLLSSGAGGEVGTEPFDEQTPSPAPGRGWWPWRRRRVPAAPRGDDPGLRGRQASALRSLLKEFVQGDVEKALRRALPLSERGGARGPETYAGEHLPDRALDYDLQNLVHRADVAPSGVSRWSGEADVVAALVAEYRKAADRAVRRGDSRRAAAIYGMLLRDYRAAAQVLQRGGLHHDAAVLLLARLDDRRGAAREFEAAGETDRAVRLYRELGDHEAAGDVLRKVGDEAATDEYVIAAGRLAAEGGRHLVAGTLLLEKAGLPEPAARQFSLGWARRPAPNAVSCAIRLAEVLAMSADLPALRSLIDEADLHFAADNGLNASRFYNRLAQLSELPAVATAGEELRDRALTGLAARLRHLARPGGHNAGLVTQLLGSHGHWPAAVVRDAEHAVAAVGRPPVGDGGLAPDGWATRVRLGLGVVTAAAAAPVAGVVFAGFDGGEVVAFRPGESELVGIASYDLPVVALSTADDGESLIVLRANRVGRGILSAFRLRPDGRYSARAGAPLEGLGRCWLTPVLETPGRRQVGLWDGLSLHALDADNLMPCGSLVPPRSDAEPLGGLLLDDIGFRGRYALLMSDGNLVQSGPDGENLTASRTRAGPIPVDGPAGRTAPSWFHDGAGRVEFACLGEGGALHWARFHDGELVASCTRPASASHPCLAAGIVRDDLVAGVLASGVDWLRCGASRFARGKTTIESFDSPVGCFPCQTTNELIVVERGGTLVRLNIPG